MAISAQSLFENVAKWPIDARDESDTDYFVRFRGIADIETGRAAYVIGRKGSGKTAIAEYLHSHSTADRFSKILSFNNFPFNILYSQRDDSYRPSSAYITIWKYLIYSTTCSLMRMDHGVPPETRSQLDSVFNLNFDAALGSSVQQITGKKFGVTVAGTGFNWSRDKGTTDPVDVTTRADALERLLLECGSQSTYLLMFDALDDDYTQITDTVNIAEYINLLISLFKAVSEVRRVFARSQIKLFPVVFLRDDIFSLINSHDKNKWLERLISLSWSEESLRNLIVQRIGRASEQNVDTERFYKEEVLLRFFRNLTYSYWRKDELRDVHMVDYMLRATLLRPRDIIRFVRDTARYALSKKLNRVTVDDIRSAERSYSEYLRQELEDEIHPILPEIRNIFEVFSRMRKEIFSTKEFRSRLDEEYPSILQSSPVGFDDMLKVLYKFGVIGNVTARRNFRMFSYSSTRKDIYLREQLCLHRGLYRGLHITDTRDLISVGE